MMNISFIRRAGRIIPIKAKKSSKAIKSNGKSKEKYISQKERRLNGIKDKAALNFKIRQAMRKLYE